MSETIREAVDSAQGIWCTLETLVRAPGSVLSEWAAPAIGGQCSWGGIRQCPPDRATFFISNYTSGSDYSGDSVTRANFEVMLEKFSAHVVEMFGGHGTYGIALPLSPWADADAERAAAEILEGLADYAVIDDDEMCSIEMEWMDAAWEDWARKDFIMALRARSDVFGTDDEILDRVTERLEWEEPCGKCGSPIADHVTGRIDDHEPETLRELLREFFESALAEQNGYWVMQHSDAWVDVKSVAKGIPAAKVRAFAMSRIETVTK